MIVVTNTRQKPKNGFDFNTVADGYCRRHAWASLLHHGINLLRTQKLIVINSC